MIYQLSHFIKDKFPLIWDAIEFFNEKIFLLRYAKKLQIIPSILEKYNGNFFIKVATIQDLYSLVSFFSAQPQEAYKFFHPHEFDEKSLKKLIRRKTQLMFVVEKNKKIVGYAFLRCFFTGKCFRGKIVDVGWRGKGIAVMMGNITTEVAVNLGLRMYGTISKENYASLYSSQASNEILIIEELPNDYLFVEYKPKKITYDY